METFVVIDGNSLINRAYYALPPLSAKDGRPTQAVYGFTTMLIKLMELKPSYLAVAFDLKAPTFRHKTYELYKANRKGMPEDLAMQLPILKELLGVMGITVVEKEGYEADDILGTMATRFDGPTYVVTGDRDSFQLISETTKVLMTKKGITDTVEYDRAELAARYGLSPEGVVVYKALAGDSSDNIPGVPGIGDKTATQLVQTYGTLDSLYEHIDEIGGKLKQKLFDGKESAYMSLALATIDRNVPDIPRAESCKFVYPLSQKVRDMFDELNFRSLLKREDIFADREVKVRRLPDCIDATLDDICGAVARSEGPASLIFGTDSIMVSTDGTTGYRLALRQTLMDDGADVSEVVAALKEFCEGERLKIVFDAKTLKKKLAVYDVKLVNFFDVELARYLINPSVDHETIAAVGELYGIDGGAPVVLRELYRLVSDELSAAGMADLYRKLEAPLVDVLFDMESTGFKVDQKALDELNLRYGVQINELKAEITRLAGKNFNINSPKQLASVLFEDLGIPYPKKSKTYSTSAEILEPLRQYFPIVDKVMSYRFLCKLKSTYLDGLKPLLDAGSVVHTEFKQMLTTTGRLSSVEPNLQNIPVRTDEGRGLRKLFVARDGNELVSADYSQIELRLMAHLSGDPRMVEAYMNGDDIHALTAAEVNGVSIGDVTAAMRREAKAVNFGIIYGISDFGLAQSIGVSPRAAREYIRRYFERFVGVKEYLDRVVALAYERGYAETLYGRRRYIPELKSSNHAQRSFGERVAMNMPLQGSAADIIKAAMIEVHKRLRGMESRLILQIHDELIVDAKAEEADKVKDILVDCMQNVAKLKVPLTVEVGRGKTWFDCK